MLLLDEKLGHPGIEAAVHDDVLDEEALSLPNPVASILGLREVARRPIKLGKDLVRRGRERDPLTSGKNRSHENLAGQVFLEALNLKVPLWKRRFSGEAGRAASESLGNL